LKTEGIREIFGPTTTTKNFVGYVKSSCIIGLVKPRIIKLVVHVVQIDKKCIQNFCGKKDTQKTKKEMGV
jgi:hypothetical protein